MTKVMTQVRLKTKHLLVLSLIEQIRVEPLPVLQAICIGGTCFDAYFT